MNYFWLILFITITIVTFVSTAGALTTSYGYDRSGRLLMEGHDNGKMVLYNYDSAGNLLSKSIVSIQPGDLFVDGSINLKDVIIVLKSACNLQSTGLLSYGDVNDDGKIDMSEAVYLLQKISGLLIDSK